MVGTLLAAGAILVAAKLAGLADSVSWHAIGRAAGSVAITLAVLAFAGTFMWRMLLDIRRSFRKIAPTEL